MPTSAVFPHHILSQPFYLDSGAELSTCGDRGLSDEAQDLIGTRDQGDILVALPAGLCHAIQPVVMVDKLETRSLSTRLYKQYNNMAQISLTAFNRYF